MAFYPEPRRCEMADVRPGDVVYLPYSGVVMEVYATRRATVTVDERELDCVIFSGWYTPHHHAEQRWTDDSRQRPNGYVKVIGDLRDVIAFDEVPA